MRRMQKKWFAAFIEASTQSYAQYASGWIWEGEEEQNYVSNYDSTRNTGWENPIVHTRYKPSTNKNEKSEEKKKHRGEFQRKKAILYRSHDSGREAAKGKSKKWRKKLNIFAIISFEKRKSNSISSLSESVLAFDEWQKALHMFQLRQSTGPNQGIKSDSFPR